MTKIKRILFVFLFTTVFGINFHHYDSIVVKAETIKPTLKILDQKSGIEEPNTIYITIEAEEPPVINIFIEPKAKEEKEEEPKKEQPKEEKKEKKVEEPIIQEEVISYNQYAGVINSLTPYDKELICRITFLEAGNQCIEGQRAVVEVILNRIVSPKWPNTVEGVLSAPRQFSTWKNRNNVSSEQVIQMNNILNLVSCSNDTILPDINYIYFNNKSPSKEESIKIQGHWFWK